MRRTACVFALVGCVTIVPTCASAGVRVDVLEPVLRWNSGETVKLELTYDGPLASARMKIFRFGGDGKVYHEAEIRDLGETTARVGFKVPQVEGGPGGTEDIVVEIGVNRTNGTKASTQIRARVSRAK